MSKVTQYIFFYVGKSEETFPLRNKPIPKKLKGEEENVKGVRKTSKMIIVSDDDDDEVDLEDMIEDSSPIKNKVCYYFFLL